MIGDLILAPWFPWVAAWAVIFGAVTGMVAQHKGRSVRAGIVLGALLGVIGLMIELCLADGERARS